MKIEPAAKVSSTALFFSQVESLNRQHIVSCFRRAENAAKDGYLMLRPTEYLPDLRPCLLIVATQKFIPEEAARFFPDILLLYYQDLCIDFPLGPVGAPSTSHRLPSFKVWSCSGEQLEVSARFL